jgi:hypothetical protein
LDNCDHNLDRNGPGTGVLVTAKVDVVQDKAYIESRLSDNLLAIYSDASALKEGTEIE